MLESAEKKRLSNLVNAPSVGAVLYQAHRLAEELKTFPKTEYPKQASQVSDVFLSIVDYIQEELNKVLKSGEKYDEQVLNLDDAKTRSFAISLRFIYLNLRAIRASGPNYCPPGVQEAIAHMSRNLVQGDQGGGNAVCLARAQPIYMATYSEPLKVLFKDHFDLNLLPGNLRTRDDIFGKKDQIDNSDVEEILKVFWQRWLQKLPIAERKQKEPTPPAKIAIISFAGLDDHDSLLYSIFAHEIAHFIDFCQLPHDSHSKQIIVNQLEGVRKHYSNLKVEEYSELKDRLSVFIREILADLIAQRMLGFPYFIALAELLKTMYDWNEHIFVLKDGYPNLHLRLALVLQQVLQPHAKYNILQFLHENKKGQTAECEHLLFFIAEWEQKLKKLNAVDALDDLINRKKWPDMSYIDKIIMGCLSKCLPALISLSIEIVPDEKAPSLTPSIFKRIELLNSEKPPSLEKDGPHSFHDIMFASWAYQVIHGEKKELGLLDPEKKYEEYVKVCDLVAAALNNAV